MVIRGVYLFMILALSAALAGCYDDFGPVVAVPAPLPITTTTTYFEVGDKLTVTFYDEPTLTGVYDVTPAGVVVLPLIGAVRAVGRTRAGLEREITRLYTRGKFLQDPKVTVDVVEFRPIYLLGEVEKPGAYPYSPGLNALTAIATAGGLTYRGSRSTILVQRAGELVWRAYPLVSSVAIMPGDLIRAPERYF
jgi:protein involved in polysaccharide export with SLBB domain